MKHSFHFITERNENLLLYEEHTPRQVTSKPRALNIAPRDRFLIK